VKESYPKEQGRKYLRKHRGRKLYRFEEKKRPWGSGERGLDNEEVEEEKWRKK